MKTQINAWAAWILARIQFMAADFDTEALQWPGGTFIAFFFWLYVKVPSFWSASPYSSATLQEAAQ
jgi:hypothetical protein